MENLDPNQEVTPIILTPGGSLETGTPLETGRPIKLDQLQEGALFIPADSKRVFQIQQGVAQALDFVVERRRPRLEGYICEDGGYGPATGFPRIPLEGPGCL